MIFFLTGASGVGKTSLVEKLAQDHANSGFEFYHFDSIGIPSSEEMALIENWQEKATHDWIQKLVETKGEHTIVFEGSTNMKFIISGFEKYNFKDYRIFLVDCDETNMEKRLIGRGQPELVTEDMKNWLRYLRNQAKEFSTEIIDTTNTKIEDSVQLLLQKIKNMTNENHYADAAMLIRKPIAEVFQAFIDPEVTTKFWFTKASGKLEEGRSVEWTWEMFNHTVSVLVKTIIPNEKIIIQWGDNPNATVEWTFKKMGDSQTFVSIHNKGFTGTTDELISQIRDATGGFTWVLAGLKAYLEFGIELNLIADRYPTEK